MSRFAKLVNAQAAREQEAPSESQEQRPSKQAGDEREVVSQQEKLPTPVPTPVITGVGTPVSTGVVTPVDNNVEAQREPARTSPQYLDATHTSSEQRVYSIMYRETVSRGIRERHFGPKELCEKTGIRSDRTVRTALDGLIEKLSIEIVSHSNGSPLGPRYRVFEPKEIAGRRKAIGIEIDPQSKKLLTPVATGVSTPVATGDKNYRGTGVEITGVTGVEITGVSNKYRNVIGGGGESAAGSSSNLTAGADDEAYAGLLSRLREAVTDVTGRESNPADAERWSELADLLVTELKIAAGRTDGVSSVPAFLTEHLRRRLWKKDKRQIEAEASSSEKRLEHTPEVDASQCPDCFGTGMWYPEGFEKGVARCRHEKLTAE
ncbi:MAG TPA: hypothetical protein VF736_18505 [Pyrinomonadaceae bacterium]|jgi:hypothetical protein